MIQRLSTGHSKKIAAFLFILFYTEFCCYYRAIAASHYSNAGNVYAGTIKKSGNNPAAIAIMSAAKVPEKKNMAEKPVLRSRNAMAARVPASPVKKAFNGGPGQPEMQSFQSVNTNNMVDLFSGDFSYNIPLMDVGGYPVNLHYRSGISMDQEASWVGLGWNVNPGSITRNMRGIPDDFNGSDMITKTLSVKKNWTAGANVGFSPELFGFDLAKALHIGFNASLFYNNYKGIGMAAGVNASISGGMGSKGSLTGGLSIVNNSQSGISISPSFDVMTKSKKDGYGSTGFSVGTSFSTRGGLQALTVGVKGERKTDMDAKNLRLGNFDLSSSISFVHQAYTPTIQIPFTNVYTSLSVKGGTELFGFSGEGSIGGYFSEQYIAKNDRVRQSPAYGYLYLQLQNDDKPNALLDFNREKELTYRESPSTPHLAIPVYTHDIYSISGEGTGGMFRPYRSDIGYVHDQTVKSKSVSASLGLELGGGNLIHAGGNIEPSISVTASNIWTGSNELKKTIPYNNSNAGFEAVYFRNPGEKTINTQDFYDKIGDTDPMLPLLDNNDDPVLTRKLQPYKKLQQDGSAITFTSNTLKASRDKRTQVISYLTADVASSYALDKANTLYPENAVYAGICDMPPVLRGLNTEQRVYEYRKSHHLSEITVLNNDGRRYMYGLPVYNVKQADVSFSVDKSKGDLSTGMVDYTAAQIVQNGQTVQVGQNSPDVNVKNTDNYFSKEEIPGYAHSFMLTGILSADYVDRLEDGITDDDQGDAVKFNYSRIFGNNNNNFYKWRTPFAQNKANYNEGLKTDSRDDKGSYIYGEKEIVYLNSIESKTMIAVFTLNNPITETRKDGYQAAGENGGIDVNPANTLRYLKKIDLYAKSDLLKNKATAKPIKTVNFEYGYDLCRNNPSSVNGEGKLTLKKVWFTYNTNQKGRLNPYLFYYHPTDIINKNNTAPDPRFNPAYHPKKYDRWGNYKDVTDNPSALDNADYPYAVQDAAKANDNASAWTLTDIQLPSGGRLNVGYESDDYAWVQNKRAAVMTQIVGFGNSATLSNSSSLYKNVGIISTEDNHYVFVRVAEPVASKADVYQKYLEGMEKLYLRLRVKMPGDVYGSGYEQVTTYARIEDYGTTSDASVIWIKLQGTGDLRPNGEKESPLTKTALQLLRLNMPSKAYPGSDVGSTVSPEAVIRMMLGYMVNYSELFTKFGDRARGLEWTKEADLTTCFVRLHNPSYKKYGGGLRVKKIMVYDNWTAMTGQKEATYGQEYDYSTTRKINGADKIISSGVAAYEPTIGNEENPFRLPVEYDEQIAPLAPVNNMYSEEPLGESYFPSASVGYSKVRVHSIHAKDIKSATGFDETEFYTTYDFPTLVDKTVLDERKYKPSILGQLLKINAKRYLTQAQGFSVETSDMDGKMKANASYPENDPTNALAYTKYYYQTDDDKPEQKHLNNTVSVVTGAAGQINNTAQVGKSVEMLVDLREQRSVTQGFVAELNADGFLFGIVPITTVIPYGYPQYEENRYRSVATLKLVQRYGILNRVEHYEKGSRVTTENLLYDSETGETVLSRVENEFKDPVYTFNYPAHWAYSGMGLAYQNIGATFSGITITDGKITNAGGYQGIENYFESGDEVMLYGITGLKRNSLAPNCDGEITACAGLTASGAPILKAWAIAPGKIQKTNGIDDLRFIDQDGKLISTSANIKMTILRSGKRNITTASAGTITSLASPVQQVGAAFKLAFDETTKVINAAATSYKDFWKVEDAKYKPFAYQSSTNALQHVVLNPNTSFSIAHECDCSSGTYNGSTPGLNHFTALLQTPYFEMAQRYGGSGSRVRTELHSWMKFDLKSAGIPANAVIVNASLKLYPHFGDHTERPAGSPGEKDHTATNPNTNTSGTYDNEGYLYFDNNPNLQNTAIPATLTDNNAFTQSILLTNRNTSNNNCPGCAVVRSSNLQNGYTVNLKSQLAAELPRYANNGNPNGSWIRLLNTDINNSNNRLCFWSTNNSNNTGCDIYADGVPANTAASAAALSVAAPTAAISAVPAASPQVSICTGCSIVTAGSGKFTCTTTPELTIDYLPLCANGLPPVEICGKFYCSTTVDPPCTSYILDTAINPYRFGILGNWRMNRAYTYFDKRKETNPGAATSIRDNGVVASNFLPYWTFNNGPLLPATDTVKWVWNSEMTLFNRKGFEIENRDPLGRYNSVQYGYSQTLPVAVSQNARYTDQAFEGFEDADYDNNGCAKPCAIPRHFNITDNLAAKRTTDQAHSGKYSLQLNAGETITTTINVKTSGTVDAADTLWYKIDTVNLYTKSVVPKGKGLSADYYYKDANCTKTTGSFSTTDYTNDIKPTGTPYKTVLDKIFNFSYGNNQINAATTTIPCRVSGVANYYFIRWTGYAQPVKTGYYTLSATSDNAFRLFMVIDGREQLIINNWPNNPLYTAGASGQVYLKKGVLYQLRAEFNQGDGPHNLAMQWLPPNGTVPEPFTNMFYPINYTAADTAGSVKLQNLGRCINPEGVRAKKQIIYNGFMPAAETKYLLGAWVKEQAINTTGADYQKLQIRAAFFDKSNNIIGAGTVIAKPTGTIIEGWQRIEEFVTVPKDAVYMQLSFTSLVAAGTANGAVYFDDIRVHPFNANMKSFVYNPVDLKLMAELDENNYASFYEYDDEGTLIRVKKETERGIKTIKETRSALIKDNP